MFGTQHEIRNPDPAQIAAAAHYVFIPALSITWPPTSLLIEAITFEARERGCRMREAARGP